MCVCVCASVTYLSKFGFMLAFNCTSAYLCFHASVSRAISINIGGYIT